MSILNLLLDIVKKVMANDSTKVIVVSMNEDNQISTNGAGPVDTSHAVFMLSRTLGNVFLEMTPEQRAEYPITQMLDDVNKVVVNYIAAMDPTALQELQQHTQGETITVEPVEEPQEVAAVPEVQEAPVVKPKRTRKKKGE